MPLSRDHLVVLPPPSSSSPMASALCCPSAGRSFHLHNHHNHHVPIPTTQISQSPSLVRRAGSSPCIRRIFPVAAENHVTPCCGKPVPGNDSLPIARAVSTSMLYIRPSNSTQDTGGAASSFNSTTSTLVDADDVDDEDEDEGILLKRKIPIPSLTVSQPSPSASQKAFPDQGPQHQTPHQRPLSIQIPPRALGSAAVAIMAAAAVMSPGRISSCSVASIQTTCDDDLDLYIQQHPHAASQQHQRQSSYPAQPSHADDTAAANARRTLSSASIASTALAGDAVCFASSASSAMILSPRASANNIPTDYFGFPFTDRQQPNTDTTNKRPTRRPSLVGMAAAAAAATATSPTAPTTPNQSSLLGSLFNVSVRVATSSFHTALNLIPSSSVRATVQGIVNTAAATLTAVVPSVPAVAALTSPPLSARPSRSRSGSNPPATAFPFPPTSPMRRRSSVLAPLAAIAEATDPLARFKEQTAQPAAATTPGGSGDSDFLAALRSTLKERKFSGRILAKNRASVAVDTAAPPAPTSPAAAAAPTPTSASHPRRLPSVTFVQSPTTTAAPASPAAAPQQPFPFASVVPAFPARAKPSVPLPPQRESTVVGRVARSEDGFAEEEGLMVDEAGVELRRVPSAPAGYGGMKML
ncbi:hypothetical protein HDU96_001253 [Phlyctochytrium bullatum]|nr:hypothetical protein HDU96_001253 [Phlyctochytrium bullatum]